LRFTWRELRWNIGGRGRLVIRRRWLVIRRGWLRVSGWLVLVIRRGWLRVSGWLVLVIRRGWLRVSGWLVLIIRRAWGRVRVVIGSRCVLITIIRRRWFAGWVRIWCGAIVITVALVIGEGEHFSITHSVHVGGWVGSLGRRVGSLGRRANGSCCCMTHRNAGFLGRSPSGPSTGVLTRLHGRNRSHLSGSTGWCGSGSGCGLAEFLQKRTERIDSSGGAILVGG